MKKHVIFIIMFILLAVVGLAFFSKAPDKEGLILIFLIGGVSSFVGTLAGGGGLITLPAMMLTGIPIQTSIATNKFSSGIAAFSSLIYLIRRKQLRFRGISIILLLAFSGGISGAFITAHVSENTMNFIAFSLLIFALVVTLKNNDWLEAVNKNERASHHKFWIPVIPFCIAIYDGGFGPGSSTFGIIFYMKNNHSYIKAVQLTRVLIFGSCAGGFIIYYQTGFLDWPIAIAMALGSIIGSQIGLIVLPKVPLKIAKILLISIICLLITQMIYRTF